MSNANDLSSDHYNKQLPVYIAHSAPTASGSAHLILVAFQALLPEMMSQITT